MRRARVKRGYNAGGGYGGGYGGGFGDSDERDASVSNDGCGSREDVR